MTRDQDYDAAVDKGTRLLRILAEKDKTQVESAHKDVENLAQHGYHLRPRENCFEIDSIAEALRDLGVDDKMVYDRGENVRTHHTHARDGAVEGEEDIVRFELA
jgi:hypothetical protein